MVNIPVNPPSLVAPKGYAHGVLSGNTLHVAGQTALDQAGRIVGVGIVEQFRQALGNVLTTVAEVGGKPEDIVSMTIYLTDVAAYQAHGAEIGIVWRELVGSTYPAMAGIGVAGLWQPEALIEIVAVAAIPAERLTSNGR